MGETIEPFPEGRASSRPTSSRPRKIQFGNVRKHIPPSIDNFHSVLALAGRFVEAGNDGNHLREDYRLARPNYSGEKRRKDLAKKAKKEEKRLRKLQAKENPISEDEETIEAAEDNQTPSDA